MHGVFRCWRSAAVAKFVVVVVLLLLLALTSTSESAIAADHDDGGAGGAVSRLYPPLFGHPPEVVLVHHNGTVLSRRVADGAAAWSFDTSGPLVDTQIHQGHNGRDDDDDYYDPLATPFIVHGDVLYTTRAFPRLPHTRAAAAAAGGGGALAAPEGGAAAVCDGNSGADCAVKSNGEQDGGERCRDGEGVDQEEEDAVVLEPFATVGAMSRRPHRVINGTDIVVTSSAEVYHVNGITGEVIYSDSGRRGGSSNSEDSSSNRGQQQNNSSSRKEDHQQQGQQHDPQLVPIVHVMRYNMHISVTKRLHHQQSSSSSSDGGGGGSAVAYNWSMTIARFSVATSDSSGHQSQRAAAGKAAKARRPFGSSTTNKPGPSKPHHSSRRKGTVKEQGLSAEDLFVRTASDWYSLVLLVASSSSTPDPDGGTTTDGSTATPRVNRIIGGGGGADAEVMLEPLWEHPQSATTTGAGLGSGQSSSPVAVAFLWEGDTTAPLRIVDGSSTSSATASTGSSDNEAGRKEDDRGDVGDGDKSAATNNNKALVLQGDFEQELASSGTTKDVGSGGSGNGMLLVERALVDSYFSHHNYLGRAAVARSHRRRVTAASAQQQRLVGGGSSTGSVSDYEQQQQRNPHSLYSAGSSGSDSGGGVDVDVTADYDDGDDDDVIASLLFQRRREQRRLQVAQRQLAASTSSSNDNIDADVTAPVADDDGPFGDEQEEEGSPTTPKSQQLQQTPQRSKKSSRARHHSHQHHNKYDALKRVSRPHTPASSSSSSATTPTTESDDVEYLDEDDDDEQPMTKTDKFLLAQAVAFAVSTLAVLIGVVVRHYVSNVWAQYDELQLELRHFKGPSQPQSTRLGPAQHVGADELGELATHGGMMPSFSLDHSVPPHDDDDDHVVTAAAATHCDDGEADQEIVSIAARASTAEAAGIPPQSAGMSLLRSPDTLRREATGDGEGEDKVKKNSSSAATTEIASMSSSALGSSTLRDDAHHHHDEEHEHEDDEEEEEEEEGVAWWEQAAAKEPATTTAAATANNNGSTSSPVKQQQQQQAPATVPPPPQQHTNAQLFQQHYKILERIGSGGGGAVFKVQHKVTDVCYAIKAVVLQDEDDTRAKREAVLHSKLDHANVVRFFYCWIEDMTFAEVRQLEIFTASDEDELVTTGASSIVTSATNTSTNKSGKNQAQDETSGSPSTNAATAGGEMYKVLFIQMEYFSNGTLADLLQVRSHFSRRECLSLLRDVAVGLEYLHTSHVLHRDLKPLNIFVGDHKVMKIGDFGLSATNKHPAALRDTITVHAAATTGAGATYTAEDIETMCGGSPLYASPEQIRGDKATPASDIFSLGVLAFEVYNQFRTMHERAMTIQEFRGVLAPGMLLAAGNMAGHHHHRRVVPQKLLDSYGPEMKLFLKMTSDDAARRPTARQARREIEKLLEAVRHAAHNSAHNASSGNLAASPLASAASSPHKKSHKHHHHDSPQKHKHTKASEDADETAPSSNSAAMQQPSSPTTAKTSSASKLRARLSGSGAASGGGHGVGGSSPPHLIADLVAALGFGGGGSGATNNNVDSVSVTTDDDMNDSIATATESSARTPMSVTSPTSTMGKLTPMAMLRTPVQGIARPYPRVASATSTTNNASGGGFPSGGSRNNSNDHLVGFGGSVSPASGRGGFGRAGSFLGQPSLGGSDDGGGGVELTPNSSGHLQATTGMGGRGGGGGGGSSTSFSSAPLFPSQPQVTLVQQLQAPTASVGVTVTSNTSSSSASRSTSPSTTALPGVALPSNATTTTSHDKEGGNRDDDDDDSGSNSSSSSEEDTATDDIMSSSRDPPLAAADGNINNNHKTTTSRSSSASATAHQKNPGTGDVEHDDPQ